MTTDPHSPSPSSDDQQTEVSPAPVSSSVGPSWLDQDEILRRMWDEQKSPNDIADALSRSVAAIMTRAARLGLPRRMAPGRKRGYKRTDAPRRVTQATKKVKIVLPDDAEAGDTYAPPQAMARVCLMCLNKFQSLGRFNRICPGCKGSAEYATGSSTPDFTFQVSN